MRATPVRPSRRDVLALGLGTAAGWTLAPLRAQPGNLATRSLREARDLVRRGEVSPVELTRACLERIDRYDPAINAYITVTREAALEGARAMEAEQRRGAWRGPLHGVPLALKDNIDTAGVLTTGASELFSDRVPGEDAEVVRRLKGAGAILLGKLNLHEFAYGGSSTVTYYGAVHNPWALDHQAGGSSGGPAAALAADLCFGSLGTDTAGSVRIPASYCGIVGFKPTYGRVSNRGVIPLSWTLDHTGPMSRTVEDAALLLNVIAGYDPRDPTSVDVPVPDYTAAIGASTQNLRVGVPGGAFFDDLHPDVQRAFDEALRVVRTLTARVSDVTLPPAPNPAAVWGPEIYAYHSTWIVESPEKYQPTTRRAIRRSADAKAWEYARARRDVDLARLAIKAVFDEVDLLVTPTMKGPAPPLEGPGGGLNTSQFDVYGTPTISVPCGFSSDGLPLGLQISGAPFAETTVLALAHAYEQATGWHTRRPPL